MASLRCIEIKLEKAGIKRTAEDVMEDMLHLHYDLAFAKGTRTPIRRLETSRKIRVVVLSAFGYNADEGGGFNLSRCHTPNST